MKSLLKNLSAVFLFITVSSFAQAPEGITYQATIRDANDSLRSEELVWTTVSILDSDGFEVYRETHIDTTNKSGLVTFVIGQGGTNLDEGHGAGHFYQIDWSKGPYRKVIKIEFRDGHSLVETIPITSVPYAFYADKAGDAKTVNGFTVDSDVPSDAVFTDDQTAIEVAINEIEGFSPSGNNVQSAMEFLGAEMKRLEALFNDSKN